MLKVWGVIGVKSITASYRSNSIVKSNYIGEALIQNLSKGNAEGSWARSWLHQLSRAC
jgi:hypothetical protein